MAQPAGGMRLVEYENNANTSEIPEFTADLLKRESQSSSFKRKKYVYRVSSFRWFILIIYALSLTSTAFAMMNFSPVSKTIAEIYMVDDIVVNACVLIFLIAFIVMNFVTVQALEYSVSKTFKFCAFMIILGSWVRYAAIMMTDNFYLLLVGQALIAIFQPFLGNAASKVATSWFADDERAIATTIGSLSIPLGCIMGMVTGPFFISDRDKVHHSEGK